MKNRVFFYISIYTSIISIFFASCKNNSGWEHSAALLIKGKEVKMSMYGSYLDAINEWDKLKVVLDKVGKVHSKKKVLIRVISPKEGGDKLVTNYVISKVGRYLTTLDVSYEIRDERDN